jgi:predicted permease
MNIIQVFGEVAWTVILPIFLLIGLGFYLGRKFRLDAGTLNKLNLYALAPGLIFSKFFHSSITLAEAGGIAVFWAVLVAGLWLLSSIACSIFRVKPAGRSAVHMASMFSNTGNYGIPAAELAFGPAGVAIQVVILAMQDLLFFTLGLFVAGGGFTRARQALGLALRMPFLYAIFAAVILRAGDWSFPAPLDHAITLLGQGLIPVALLTLGAQLGATRIKTPSREIPIAVTLRLVGAPLLAFALARAFSLDPILSASLVVAASFPTAVNTALIAIEMRRNEVLSSAMVVATTLLSAVTVTLAIALSRI